MELITTEKPTHWTDRLRDMEINASIHADLSAKNTVRAAIQRVSLMEKKQFTTKKTLVSDQKKIEALEIKRVK